MCRLRAHRMVTAIVTGADSAVCLRQSFAQLRAVQWLEEAGSARLHTYAQTFAAQAVLLVESKIVLPVQTKLPLLNRP